MHKEWGSFFYNEYFFNNPNFYAAAEWVWIHYLGEVINPDEEYSSEDLEIFCLNLMKMVKEQDFIEDTNINFLLDLETTLDTAEYILTLTGRGLADGAFMIEDLMYNQAVIAGYILAENIDLFYSSEFTKDNYTGEELLRLFDIN